MHLRLITSFLLLFPFLGLFSCGWNKAGDSSADEIQVQLALPKAGNDSQEYSFQVVPLLNIYNLKQLRGAYARFYLNPGIESNHLMGDYPRAELLKNQSGIYIPQNELSYQMASIYYHMQKMALFDQKVGAGEVNKWPRDIGLRVSLQTSNDNLNFQDNNAVYDGMYDAILIVPYNKDKIPLSMNAGVLAHEHFHSLFFKLVTAKLIENNWLSGDTQLSNHQKETDNVDSLARITLLKAVNEGLADFWGLIYTQDENFIYPSLSEVEKTRSLHLNSEDEKNFRLETPREFQACMSGFALESSKCNSGMVNYAYTVGTGVAKSMRLLSNKIQTERKLDKAASQALMAKAIVIALRTLPQTLMEAKAEVSLKMILSQIVNSIESLQTSECDLALNIMKNSEMIKTEKCQVVDAKVRLQ